MFYKRLKRAMDRKHGIWHFMLNRNTRHRHWWSCVIHLGMVPARTTTHYDRMDNRADYYDRANVCVQRILTMFIELTEIVKEGLSTYASAPKQRPISINVNKIQALHTEASTGNCIIEMRRESIKVKETYEEVKEKIQA